MTEPRSEEIPKGWGDDELSAFIDLTRHNILATFANLPDRYTLIRDVDRAFLRLLENLDKPSDQLAPLFLYRGHAAWRAAVRVGLSGQVPESYPLLRIAIEHALLASFMNRHANKFALWSRRSDSEEDRKKVRNEFATGKLLSDLEERDRSTHAGVKELYEECIDMGSHPTDAGVFTHLVTSETPDVVAFDTQYLMGDSPQLRYVLKMLERVGVAVLKVGHLLFKERFDLLGLSETLDRLALSAGRAAT